MKGYRKFIAFNITLLVTGILSYAGTLDSTSVSSILSSAIWALAAGNAGEHLANKQFRDKVE